MRVRAGLFLLALAGGALGCAGCGTGSDTVGSTGASSEASAPTAVADRSDYVAEANSICREAKATLDASSVTATSLDPKAGNDYLVATMRTMVNQLRTLTPPPGDEATTTAIYDQFDDLTTRQEALYSTDWSSTDELDQADAELQALGQQSDADAVAFGLVDCTFGPTG